MEKTAVAFLTDYRSGAIGRVSLETPQSRQLMMQVGLPTVTEVTDQTTEDDKE